MTKWQHQYPSVWVTRTYDGDRLKAVSYIGEGNKLLYQLKNNMTFNNLGRLKMERIVRDIQSGTILAIIRVESVFGHDTVYIYCPPVSNASCTITLYDLPKVVPPMKWLGLETLEKINEVWVIREPGGVIEVEGVDYIKTYYSYTVTQCPSCDLPKITLSDRTIGEDVYELIDPLIDPESIRRSFRYKSETDNGTLIYTYDGIMVPHYMGDAESEGMPPEPKTHTIYSFDGLDTTHKGYDAQAEIIKFDTDGGGTYFLWKAYTDFDTYYFSRGGLGYMLMKAFVYNGGAVLCESEPTIIKVDCCEKPIADRPVEAWWEGNAGYLSCDKTSFMYYNGTTICKIPTSVPSTELFFYTSVAPAQPFYAIPEIKGSCLPVEWILTGLTFRGVSEKNDHIIYTIWNDISKGYADCHDEALITLKDRCGTEYQVIGTPCCGYEEELVINYTSLFMSCGEVQQFLTTGGCGENVWSASMGSITQDGLYTSPVNNPGCGNPVITVTDCCGTTASITLGVSCYDPSGRVAINDKSGQMTLPCVWDAGWGYWKAEIRVIWRYYDCTGQAWIHGTDPVCCHPPSCVGHIWTLVSGNEAVCNSWLPCYASPCITAPPCGITDVRLPADLAAGCCPINPATGFPWGYIPFAWE